MRGTVQHINPVRGMVAVLTDDGDYSIVELIGDEVEIGDVVSWTGDTPLGGDTLVNHTRNEKLDVYFQNHHVTSAQLRQQLLL
jgi:hypothetical protein